MTKKIMSVDDFLISLKQSNPNQYANIVAVRALVLKTYPDVQQRIIYGGIMFSLDQDCGGIYPYEHHSSFEFSKGSSMQDISGILEGKGKHRRHIKLYTLQDIEDKNLVYYIEQMQ